MSFWDGKVDNSMDRMFDRDGDGYLNPKERAMRDDFMINEYLENDDDYDTSCSSNTRDVNNGKTIRIGPAGAILLIIILAFVDYLLLKLLLWLG